VIFTIEIVREGSPDVRLIEEWSTESSATLRSYLGLISKIFNIVPFTCKHVTEALTAWIWCYFVYLNLVGLDKTCHSIYVGVH